MHVCMFLIYLFQAIVKYMLKTPDILPTALVKWVPNPKQIEFDAGPNEDEEDEAEYEGQVCMCVCMFSSVSHLYKVYPWIE